MHIQVKHPLHKVILKRYNFWRSECECIMDMVLTDAAAAMAVDSAMVAMAEDSDLDMAALR